MKPNAEPERILNVKICANLALKMTEQMKKLYDEFWEKEKKFFEDDSISEEEYEAAREKLEADIVHEMEELYPYIEGIYVEDFDERV